MEPPIAEKIVVLLALDDVARDTVQDLRHLCGRRGGAHNWKARVAGESQAVSRCTFHKLVKINRLIHAFEVLVSDVGIRMRAQDERFIAENPRVVAVLLGGVVTKELQK